jgi:pimeloyl-ACP methyl ester carboxylesterase
MRPVWIFAGLLVLACDGHSRRAAQLDEPTPSNAPPSASAPPAPPPSASAPPPREPVSVEETPLPSGKIAFILHGARGSDRIVFLHGLCGHGQGYLQSFQFTAADHGIAVAPHGDVGCSGVWRSWSNNLGAIEQQIEDSLTAAGAPDARGITLIGYSLGATRAEALARKHTDRYDAVILIAAPTAPLPAKLSHLRAAAMMAGSKDRQDHMKAAAQNFTRAGIPSRYFVLPNATHGAMGDNAEKTMAEVLDWVAAQPPKPE